MQTWIDSLIRLEAEAGLLIFVRGREDVEERVNRPLTDKEWETVKETAAWRKGGHDDWIGHLVNEVMDEAIRQAGIEGSL